MLFSTTELTTLLTENRDYQVLQTAWTDWREVSGKKVRQDYIRYVELANKEARQNSESADYEYIRIRR